MTMILTDDRCETMQRQVANLWGEVNELRATLAECDMEQCEMEGVLEFLLEQNSHHLFVLGAVVERVLGRDSWFHKALYPETITGTGLTNSQAPGIAWSRPNRRWTQFGSRAELDDMVNRLGVRPKIRGRQSAIRALWKIRALPGSVARHAKAAALAAELSSKPD